MDKIQRDLVKVLGDSWPGKESESTRAWGDLPQNEVFLEAAGFVSPGLGDPRQSGTGLGWRKGERAQWG